jgi:hypothetical protein
MIWRSRPRARLFDWPIPVDFRAYSQDIWLSYLRRRAVASVKGYGNMGKESLSQWASAINAAPAHQLAQTIFKERDDDKWWQLLGRLRDLEGGTEGESRGLADAIYRLQSALGMVELMRASGDLVDTRRLVGR